MKKRKGSITNSVGFTLIEIMVVLAILALLMTAGIVQYGELNKSGRDKRRQTDINILANTLESFKNNQAIHSYPNVANYAALQSELSPTYIKDWPQDPLSGCTYAYFYDSSADQYTLYYYLEKGGSAFGVSCGTCGNCRAQVSSKSF